MREQTIEDLPSGLTLRLEACEGGCAHGDRGDARLLADREIVFDAEGRLMQVRAASTRSAARPGCIEILHL